MVFAIFEEYYQALTVWWLLISWPFLIHLAESAAITIQGIVAGFWSVFYKFWRFLRLLPLDLQFQLCGVYCHTQPYWQPLTSWAPLLQLVEFAIATILYKPWDCRWISITLLICYHNLQVLHSDTFGSLVSILGCTVTPNWLAAADQLSPPVSPGKILHCYHPI